MTTTLHELPTTFILLTQAEFPTPDQVSKLKEKYLDLGYTVAVPLNIQEIEYKTSLKTTSKFFAIEVTRKEM